MKGGFAPFTPETPVFIGIPREQMKGEGFLRIPFLKKPIMIKVLSYGTKVPFLKQLYRKGK